jgi:hypothetical protein
MRLKKRDRILLLAIAPLAIVALFWWFHARPASQHLGEVRSQVTQARSEVTALRATLAQLAGRQPNLAAQAAEELRLAKAVPASTQVPAALVQLERLAQRANVKLTSLQLGTATAVGALQSTTVTMNIEGRFFDVDDFLYRLHRQVQQNRAGRLVVRGRLIAAKDITMPPGGSGQTAGTPTPAPTATPTATPSLTGTGGVQATIQAVLFSTADAPAAAAASIPIVGGASR